MKIKQVITMRAEKKEMLDNFTEVRWYDYKRTNETHVNELANWVADSYNVVLGIDPSLNRAELTYLRRTLVEPMLKATWENKKLK